jgi:hypothetical protein
MKIFNPKRIRANWTDMTDNVTSKFIRFEVSKEDFKNIALGDRILLNHRRIRPAFYIISELFAEQGRYEIKCIHEFNAIGYKPFDSTTMPNFIQSFIGEVEVGDIVTVMGIEHIVEDLDSSCIRIKPL